MAESTVRSVNYAAVKNATSAALRRNTSSAAVAINNTPDPGFVVGRGSQTSHLSVDHRGHGRPYYEGEPIPAGEAWFNAGVQVNDEVAANIRRWARS